MSGDRLAPVVRLPVPPLGALRVVTDLGADAVVCTFPVAWWGARSDRMARRAHNTWLAEQVKLGLDNPTRW